MAWRYFFFVLLVLVAHLPYGISKQCNPANCRLPNCFCAGRAIPGNLTVSQTPQLVLFSFDDKVDSKYYEYYQRLFPPSRKNPNGCSIKATFFVSHENTQYEYVKRLYQEGHEIAAHSISHKFPETWWGYASKQGWADEMVGQRNYLSQKAGIPSSEIRGIRAPFLQVGGDNQFNMMKENNFEYDSSFYHGPFWQAGLQKVDPVWPFSLDTPPSNEFCDNSNCPKQPHPGIWEISMNPWMSVTGGGLCSMMDSCLTPYSAPQALEYFKKNFNRNYNRNRAPLGIHLHSTWFWRTHNLDGMDLFIKELLANPNVYIVTMHQAIEWVKQPTPIGQMSSLAAFGRNCNGGSKPVHVKSDQQSTQHKPKRRKLKTPTKAPSVPGQKTIAELPALAPTHPPAKTPTHPPAQTPHPPVKTPTHPPLPTHPPASTPKPAPVKPTIKETLKTLGKVPTQPPANWVVQAPPDKTTNKPKLPHAESTKKLPETSTKLPTVTWLLNHPNVPTHPPGLQAPTHPPIQVPTHPPRSSSKQPSVKQHTRPPKRTTTPPAVLATAQTPTNPPAKPQTESPAKSPKQTPAHGVQAPTHPPSLAQAPTHPPVLQYPIEQAPTHPPFALPPVPATPAPQLTNEKNAPPKKKKKSSRRRNKKGRRRRRNRRRRFRFPFRPPRW